MSWLCPVCSSNNAESDCVCMVCSAERPAEIPYASVNVAQAARDADSGATLEGIDLEQEQYSYDGEGFSKGGEVPGESFSKKRADSESVVFFKREKSDDELSDSFSKKTDDDIDFEIKKKV